MQYKLNTYVSKKDKKCAFVLEVSGKEVTAGIFGLNGDFTESILNCITKGLRACKTSLKHSDILCICVQNDKVYRWLNDSFEDRDYADKLEELYNTLDTLDCKYRCVVDKNSYAKIYLDSHKNDVKGSGIEETFANM